MSRMPTWRAGSSADVRRCARTWERAARLNWTNPGVASAEHEDVFVGRVGNLAYVLSRERIQVTREGVTECLAARATNVFRREAGTWRMTYRHAEAPRHENVEVARLLRGGVAEEMYGRHATARPRRGG